MEDVAAALTDSLSRSGSGGMQVPFRNVDGSAGGPGITWVNEANTGLYRFGSQDMRIVVGGNDRMRLNASGAQLWNGSIWSPIVTDATQATALGGYALKAGNETVSGTWTFNIAPIAPGLTNPTAIAFTIGATVRGTYSATGLNVIGLLQQSGVNVALGTTTIAGATSVAGGGDLSANRTLTLVNDAASPGTSFYYGTDSGGIKGWYSLSATGGVPEAPIDGTTYGRNNASWIAVGAGGSFLPLTGGTLTGPLVINEATGFPLKLVSDSPVFAMNNNLSAANNKVWGIALSSTTLALRLLADTYAPGANALLVTRSSAAVTAMEYGNVTNVPTHTFRGAVTAANGLAVTGAATVSTTLGVTGAATMAAITASGLVTGNAGFKVGNGNGITFSNAGSTVNYNFAFDSGTFQMIASAGSTGKGAFWFWEDGTVRRGSVSITTTPPTGNDPAKAGNVVLVY
jgi:hypothetical protein